MTDINTDGWRPTRQELGVFLRSEIWCTFVTIDATGAPDGATVAFSETVDGNFLIGTSRFSHKAQNVQADDRVAIVVSDSYRNYTALIKGNAQIVSDEDKAQYEEEHYRQTPDSKPFKDQPDEILILIKPYFMKFSDVGVQPWAVTEFGESHI